MAQRSHGEGSVFNAKMDAGTQASYPDDQHIYVWSGNYYAQEIMERLGRGEHGMVRVGPVHYNTVEEIDRLLAALAALTRRRV